MSYLVSQMRKDINTTYMTNISVSPSTISSPNTFGGSVAFTDFALAGNFIVGKVYYLRFQIHKIPQYYYSGSRTREEVPMYVADADTLNLQIILKNSTQNDEEKNPPQIIGTCKVPQAKYDEAEAYSSYSFVFTPSNNFDRLGFRINRVSFDAINVNSGNERNWLIENPVDVQNVPRYTSGQDIVISTRGPRIYYNNENGDVCTLDNLVTKSASSSWLKFGYQCRPGSLIVVNKQPIRLGRSGIYQINNGTTITDFMIASPGGSDASRIDAFLLDYAYKS